MKPLSKSLRQANRYILFRITCDDTITFSDLDTYLYLALSEWIGKFRMGKFDIQLVKDSVQDDCAIIATNAKGLAEVRSALELTYLLGEKKVSLQTIKSSGTLKKLKTVR